MSFVRLRKIKNDNFCVFNLPRWTTMWSYPTYLIGYLIQTIMPRSVVALVVTNVPYTSTIRVQIMLISKPTSDLFHEKTKINEKEVEAKIDW